METTQHELFKNIPVKQTVLPNGLTVITAQTTHVGGCVELVIKAGAFDDGKYPGRAHYLEHIKYEGPASDGIHPILRELTRKGVEGNAATNYHTTSYELSGLSEDMPAMVRALLTIAFDETIEAQYVDLERPVILRELEERETRNRARSWVMQTVCPHIPQLHIPIVGTMKSVREMTALELYDFNEHLYVPSNAALIAASARPHEEIVEAVEKIQLPKRQPQKQPRPNDRSPRLLRATYEDYNQNDSTEIYFPGIDDPDEKVILGIAFELLCAFPIGLLLQRLRMQERKVYGVQASTGEWPLVLAFDVSVPPQYFNPVEQALFEEIDRLIKLEYPQELFEIVIQRRRTRISQREDAVHKRSLVNELHDSWFDDDFKNRSHLVFEATRERIAEAVARAFTRSNYGCIHTLRKNRS